MNKLNNDYLKLAIQKEGRLTEETLTFLRTVGFEFESYKQRLFSVCRNFPLEILYVRDDDIGNYVTTGTVDLGILGQNLLSEERPKVKKLLNLRFGFCSLILAVPRDSAIKNIRDLKNLKIATTYPLSTSIFFKKNNIPVEIVKMSGSLELTPALGVAQAIADLTSTGSTLILNDLRVLGKIYDSEAVLIANSKTLNNEIKKKFIEKLIVRFKGVLSARRYKYIIMTAPRNILAKLMKIIQNPSTSIVSLVKDDSISIQSMVKEDMFWETLERLKRLGVSEITVLPVEKIIT